MSGTAKATFSCGALIYGGEGVRPDYPCGQTLTVDLVNDGHYTAFVVPDGWHIELGSTGPIVRCPKHCKWIEKTEKLMTRTARVGYWRDAP